jgi:hypothetical protein
VADVQVNTVLDWAMLCLTTAVTGNPNPPENLCRRLDLQVAHDADLYTDLCCEGLAYVSFGDVFPSFSSFPEHDIGNQNLRGPCGIPAWAVAVRMGIVRCVPSGTDTEMPTCADWDAVSRQQADDSQALRAAACCLRQRIVDTSDTPGIFWGMSATIGTQQQVQLQGGCVERNVTVMVQIPNCDCFTVE